MPDTYRIKLSDGREFEVTTEGGPPSEADILASLNASPTPTRQADAKPSMMGTALDVMKGIGKGALHTVLDAGDLASKVPVGMLTGKPGETIGSAVDAMYGTPGLSEKAFPAAREATAYTNAPQALGGALETVGELVLPSVKAAQAVPTVGKAAAKFQAVMGAAKTIPVDISAPGSIALRIQELAERGGSMPRAVRQFILRVTDPQKAPLAYEESRDFASNISRLSADEFNRLTPVIKDQVVKLRLSLNQANAKAAALAGKGAEYTEAMKEYMRAKQFENVWEAVKKGATKALPYGLAGGAAGLGYEAASKVRDLIGD